MYTGTLIEDLMATVERAEQQARAQQDELESWFASSELVVEQNYQGAA